MGSVVGCDIYFIPPLAREGGDGEKVCTDRRYYRNCPLAGCRSQPKKKLSQHRE